MNRFPRACCLLFILNLSLLHSAPAADLQIEPDASLANRYKQREAAASPAIKAKLAELRKQIETQHYTFKVGYTSALDRPIEQLAGTKRIPWPAGVPKPEKPTANLDDTMSDVRTVQLDTVKDALKLMNVTRFDYRDKGIVTPVRDQGECGDCWAFATIAALESNYLKRHPGATAASIDMSEQDLLNCNNLFLDCSGGEPEYALAYLWTRGPTWSSTAPYHAITKEQGYPYVAAVGSCSSAYFDRNYAVADYDWVPSGRGFAMASVKEIKAALEEHGPLITEMFVSPAFQAYSGGIFNEKRTDDVNHTVEIIGYVDYGAEARFFADPQHLDPFHLQLERGPRTAWIIKNSWGTDWGLGGFGLIAAGSNNVGYATMWVKGKELSAPGWPVGSPKPTVTPSASPSP